MTIIQRLHRPPSTGDIGASDDDAPLLIVDTADPQQRLLVWPVLAPVFYNGVPVQAGLVRRGRSSLGGLPRALARGGQTSARGARAAGAGGGDDPMAATEFEDDEELAEGEDSVRALRRILGDMSARKPVDESPRLDADAANPGTALRRARAMPTAGDFADLRPPANLASVLAGWRARVRTGTDDAPAGASAEALMYFGQLAMEHALELPPLTLEQCAEILATCAGLTERPGPDLGDELNPRRSLNLLLPLWLLHLGRPRASSQRRRAAERLDALRPSHS